MNVDELAPMWLRGRAEELRTAATAADRAYTKGRIQRAAEYTAAAYRRAAVVLDDAAQALEDDPGVLGEVGGAP